VDVALNHLQDAPADILDKALFIWKAYFGGEDEGDGSEEEKGDGSEEETVDDGAPAS
jgi:hypothetical protein